MCNKQPISIMIQQCLYLLILIRMLGDSENSLVSRKSLTG